MENNLDLKVGTVIIDNGKIGMIISVVDNGKWEEYGPFSLQRSYEIRYFDGAITMMKESTLIKLMDLGKVEVIAK